MRKLLVSTLLVLFALSMLALESDPSETVGFVKYACVQNANGNYNFIANSMDAGYTTASLLGADYPNITAISEWDPVTQDWVTSSNLGGGFWFPNNAMNPCEAYLISITADFDLYVAGGMNAAPSYSLVTNAEGNYNAIMLPFEQSALSMTSTLGNDIGVASTISEWDTTLQDWNTASNLGGGFWFPDFATSTGMPYLVTVTSNVTWPSAKAMKNIANPNAANAAIK